MIKFLTTTLTYASLIALVVYGDAYSVGGALNVAALFTWAGFALSLPYFTDEIIQEAGKNPRGFILWRWVLMASLASAWAWAGWIFTASASMFSAVVVVGAAMLGRDKLKEAPECKPSP